MKYQTSHLDPRIIGGLRAVLMPSDVLTMSLASRFKSLLQGIHAEPADLGDPPRAPHGVLQRTRPRHRYPPLG